MTREIIIAPLANRQIRAARTWWLANSEKAPAAFDESLEETFALLARYADTGILVHSRRRGPIRRLLIERIRYFLFYRVTDRVIEIISFWHTSRRPPRL